MQNSKQAHVAQSNQVQSALFCRNMFPREIIENILQNCDGYTLLNVYNVNSDWRSALEYITRKSDIWKRCCRSDIPHKELTHYVEHYNDFAGNDNKWLHIYENWFSWMDIKRNIKFEIILLPLEICRITCIACLNGYIVVGSEDGRVRLFNRNLVMIYCNRTRSSKVTHVSLMCDEKDLHNELISPSLVIGYNRTVVIAETSRPDPELTVYDVMLFSVYKTYICLVKMGQRVSICQYVLHNSNMPKSLYEITYTRIYSPTEITSVTMWENVCTFIINDNIKIIYYNEEQVAPVTHTPENKGLLPLNKDINGGNNTPECRILRDDVIINLDHNVIELFILHNEKISKLQFKIYEFLQGEITCMFLYGNTFLIGIHTGIVYVYDIISWKFFNIQRFRKKLIIGQHPIISIDVQESKGERNFYVASTFSIHKLWGFSPLPKLDELH